MDFANEFAEMSGRIDALTETCMALLVTTDPINPKTILAVMSLRTGASTPEKSPSDAAYKKGFLAVCSDLEAAIRTAAQAGQIRALKPEGGH
jgi:hypothetical protein